MSELAFLIGSGKFPVDVNIHLANQINKISAGLPISACLDMQPAEDHRSVIQVEI